MFSLLAASVIQRVIDRIVDVRQYPAEYTWLNRVPLTNAMDGEIFAKYRGKVYAADIIALDGKATVRSLPGVTLQATNLPVIKHGASLGREQIRLLSRIEANLATAADGGVFADFVAAEIRDLLDGVRARMEALIVGMLVDDLAYSRMGIIGNFSWGMPADLKVVNAGGALWSAPTTAKPVTDIHTLARLRRNKYGRQTTRLSMSSQAFDYMVATDEFKNLAAGLMAVNMANFILPLQNQTAMVNLAQQVTGIPTIEIDDRQYLLEGLDAAESAVRYLPENKVLLTDVNDDGNRRVWDFANAEMEEALPGMVPSLIGSFAPDQNRFGPIGYATAADPQGNPPGINLWAAASGFPRKHLETASSVLTAY